MRAQCVECNLDGSFSFSCLGANNSRTAPERPFSISRTICPSSTKSTAMFRPRVNTSPNRRWNMKNWPILRTTALRERTRGQIAVAHVSPTASAPEQVAKARRGQAEAPGEQPLGMGVESLRDRSARRGVYPYRRHRARKEDRQRDVIWTSQDEKTRKPGMRRGAVASVAAIALNFRQNSTKPT